ncbi:hypothetical protein [uncultured Dokdonia sp.]|uniref:hypothetical protein n=1 Tax=uncultured Dokdonia sp. TaxID=575653 RepID=UPI0026263D1C|nr:hypothetical protein [uncultured Dokdonia sp.]
MKKNNVLILLIISLFCTTGSTFAQQEKGIVGQNNWLSYWTKFQAKPETKPKPTQILSGEIKGDTVTLRKKEIYLLLGDVFVTDSTRLVIEPGTLILADHKSKASLIITSGSTIDAKGNQTDPIVFTSSKDAPLAGDWGGIFILGDAPSNKISEKNLLKKGLTSYTPDNLIYGGTNPESNSGVMEYVRIEYAGKRTKDFGFFDALSLYAVGNQTEISNVMMSYSKGNSLYVVGGEIDLEQLVSFKARHSDYMFDSGTQVNISNSLAVRSPYDSASKGAASIHVTTNSNEDESNFAKVKTSVMASNLTLLNFSNNLKSAIEVGLVHEAIYVDANTLLTMNKSVISGFNPAVIFNREISLNDKNLQQIRFTNMYFNSCEGNIFIEFSQNNEDLENWYGNSSFQNVYSKGEDVETFISHKNLRDPDFRLRINKIIASSSSN